MTDNNSSVTCPSCGFAEIALSLDYRGIIAESTLENQLFSRLNTLVCRRCGMGFPSMIVDKALLTKYYGEEYLTNRGHTPDSGYIKFLTLLNAGISRFINLLDAGSGNMKADRFQRQLELVSRYLDPEKVNIDTLEYGAGSARFSRLLARDTARKFKIYIIEPSPVWDNDFRAAGFIKAGADDDQLEADKFDLVHASHVFQHVPDFKRSFGRIVRCLKPGGILFIEVPNASAVYWNYRKFPNPPFLNFNTLESLGNSCRAHGLEIKFMETYGYADVTAALETMAVGGEYKKYFNIGDFHDWKKRELSRHILHSIKPSTWMRGDKIIRYAEHGRVLIRMIAARTG